MEETTDSSKKKRHVMELAVIKRAFLAPGIHHGSGS